MKQKTSLTTEFKQLILLAYPITVAQLAQTAIGVVDTLMAGNAGPAELAAIALGGSIWLPLFLAFEGLLHATTPLVAHAVGAGKLDSPKHTLHTAFSIAFLLSILSVLLMSNADIVLRYFVEDPDMLTKSSDYLTALAFGFPAILFYQAMRSYLEGFGDTRPVMVIGLIGLVSNIPLNYIFIYGKLGLPAMGGVGCGWASSISMWLMLLIATLHLQKHKNYQQFQLFKNFALSWQANGQFLKLGIPIGFSLLVESSMFAVIALLLADMGELTVATHQITLNYVTLMFMIPLSLSMALTIRVGQKLGARQVEQAHTAIKAGYLITLLFALLSSGSMVVFGMDIAALYSTDKEVIAMTAALLSIAAAFQFSDALQVASAGILRGFKDTTIPFIVALLAYWVIGLPLGLILAKTDWLVEQPLGAAGFWIALLIGLTIGAIALIIRVRWQARNDSLASSISN